MKSATLQIRLSAETVSLNFPLHVLTVDNHLEPLNSTRVTNRHERHMSLHFLRSDEVQLLSSHPRFRIVLEILCMLTLLLVEALPPPSEFFSHNKMHTMLKELEMMTQ